MPDEETLVGLVRRGREDRFLEYKRGEPWESLRARIIRTCLAMANVRGGGYIVIGVSEVSGRFQLDGVSDEVAQTYQNDAVSEQVNRYAEPYVDTELVHLRVDDRIYVVYCRTAVRRRAGHLWTRWRSGSAWRDLH